MASAESIWSKTNKRVVVHNRTERENDLASAMSPKADCGSLNVGLPRLQYTGSLTAALSEEGSQSSTMILKVVYSSLNESSAKSSDALKRGAASEGRC